MKKIVVPVLAFICAMTMLTGCGSDIIRLNEAVNMSDKELAAELFGVTEEEIIDAWGKPDSSMLNGGMLYNAGNSGKYVAVYYNADGTVEKVKTGRTVG